MTRSSSVISASESLPSISLSLTVSSLWKSSARAKRVLRALREVALVRFTADDEVLTLLLVMLTPNLSSSPAAAAEAAALDAAAPRPRRVTVGCGSSWSSAAAPGSADRLVDLSPREISQHTFPQSEGGRPGFAYK